MLAFPSCKAPPASHRDTITIASQGIQLRFGPAVNWQRTWRPLGQPPLALLQPAVGPIIGLMSRSAPVPVVDLWHVSAEDIGDVRLNECLRLLAPAEAARARRYVFERHRRQSIVAWGMLRKLLSKYAAVVPQSLVFGRNAYGKPHLAEPADSPIQFNMSHTDGMILYAVTRDRPIGVDVEDTQRRGGGIELARRFFAQAEVAALEALPPQAQHDAFFRFWTLKEAYTRPSGRGCRYRCRASPSHSARAARQPWPSRSRTTAARTRGSLPSCDWATGIGPPWQSGLCSGRR